MEKFNFIPRPLPKLYVVMLRLCAPFHSDGNENPPKIFAPLITRRASFPGFEPWSELTVEHAQHEKMHGPSPYGSWSHEWAMVWRECWRLLATWAGYSVVQFCKLWFAWNNCKQAMTDNWVDGSMDNRPSGWSQKRRRILRAWNTWLPWGQLDSSSNENPPARCLATHPINHHLVKAIWSPVFSPNMAAPSAAFAASFEDSSFAWRLPPEKPGVARTPRQHVSPRKWLR